MYQNKEYLAPPISFGGLLLNDKWFKSTLARSVREDRDSSFDVFIEFKDQSKGMHSILRATLFQHLRPEVYALFASPDPIPDPTVVQACFPFVFEDQFAPGGARQVLARCVALEEDGAEYRYSARFQIVSGWFVPL